MNTNTRTKTTPRPFRDTHTVNIFNFNSLPTHENSITDRQVSGDREFIFCQDDTIFARKLDSHTHKPTTDWVMVYTPREPMMDYRDLRYFASLYQLFPNWTDIDIKSNNFIERSFNRKPIKSTRHLILIAEHQAPNEPKHWSLFSHFPDPLGLGPGEVWQITGDDDMHFEYLYTEPELDTGADNPAKHGQLRVVDLMALPRLAWYRVLATNLTDVQRDRVDEIACEEEVPPAESWIEEELRSQEWTLRVVEKLMKEGIVGGDWLEQGKLMKRLVRNMDLIYPEGFEWDEVA